MFYFETRHRIQDREHKIVGNSNADEAKEAYTSQRYCVQLNPMNFCRRIVEDSGKRIWVEMEATLPVNTELEKVPFISIVNDPKQSQNDSLGHYFFDRPKVRAHSNATVADLVKITEEWVRKNPTYVLHEADCRHFALEVYNKLKA